MFQKIVKTIGIIFVGTALFSSPLTVLAYGPTVNTYSATNITPMNATLNGFVSTGGVPGSAYFEWGTDVSFGNSTSLNAYNFNNDYNGNYSTNISGLTAQTTYYYRGIAINSFGKVYGNVMSFTTTFSDSGYNNTMSPTAVTTGGDILANNVAQFNSLILAGNSNEANTYFEWGTTPNLGNQTEIVVASGAPAVRHTTTITELMPNTKYYFRAIAENSYGRSIGDILSLITSTNRNVVAGANNNISKNNSANINSTVLSSLSANIFQANSFFPVNLFGWLMLVILILILVLLGKHLYGEFTHKKQIQSHHH